MIIKLHDDCFNDIINTGTETAAGDNAAFQFGRIKIYFPSGSRHVEIWRNLARFKIRLDIFYLILIENMIIFINEAGIDDGGVDPALPQRLDMKFFAIQHRHTPSDSALIKH